MPTDLPVVMVVDDEEAIRKVVGAKLKLEGFEPLPVGTGRETLEMLERREPHLIILDLGLPDIDGVTVCQRIRINSGVPIIILSARSEEVNRILGLEIGADDYVTKPFSLDELMARVRAVLRRANPDRSFTADTSLVHVGDITIDTAGHEVTVRRKDVKLTPTEFGLLRALADKPGRVFSHQEFLHRVWDYDQYDTHLVEVHIANLRRKIEKNPRKPHRIVTVRGVGYKLVPF
jgi:two-component system response regulator MtrA